MAGWRGCFRTRCRDDRLSGTPPTEPPPLRRPIEPGYDAKVLPALSSPYTVRALVAMNSHHQHQASPMLPLEYRNMPVKFLGQRPHMSSGGDVSQGLGESPPPSIHLACRIPTTTIHFVFDGALQNAVQRGRKKVWGTRVVCTHASTHNRLRRPWYGCMGMVRPPSWCNQQAPRAYRRRVLPPTP